MRALIAIACAAGLAAAEQDLPFLHPMFAEHAVLQRDQALPVWGWSKPGDTVTVELAGKSATATAGADGRWRAVLPALPAGGPYTLQARGASTASVGDVLLGDVWVCSGQSNMEWVVQNSDGWPAERDSAAKLTQVRQFRVTKDSAALPRACGNGRWMTAPDAAGQFTAVGYYFARELNRELQVPVGIVNSSWGGTTIEAWMSLPALDALPRAKDVVAKRRAMDDARLARELTAWWAQVDPDKGQKGPGFDDAAWRTINLPGTWKEQGIAFDGVAWYRRSVELPATVGDGSGTLSLGISVDSDTAFVNGTEVGSGSGWDAPRVYRIPAGVLKPGANTLALRVRNWNAGAGGFYARPEQLQLRCGTSAIPLSGAWRFATAAGKAEVDAVKRDPPQGYGAALWNAMVDPLTPAAVKGVLWYQGETNAWEGSGYEVYLPALIADWRVRFAQPGLPFGVVQLAAFGKVIDAPIDPKAGVAWLRNTQFSTVRATPGTGLVVTIDIGNPADVHPRNKLEAGRRAAAWALHDVYGRATTVPSGPLFTAATVEGGAIRVAFDHAAGLAFRGEPAGFAVAGADGAWVAAQARIDGETLLVSSPQVAAPLQVSYGWAASPPTPLYNGAGLPASPFRSDRR